MEKMKKLLMVLLAFVLAFGMIACNQEEDPEYFQYFGDWSATDVEDLILDEGFLSLEDSEDSYLSFSIDTWTELSPITGYAIGYRLKGTFIDFDPDGMETGFDASTDGASYNSSDAGTARSMKIGDEAYISLYFNDEGTKCVRTNFSTTITGIGDTRSDRVFNKAK